MGVSRARSTVDTSRFMFCYDGAPDFPRAITAAPGPLDAAEIPKAENKQHGDCSDEQHRFDRAHDPPCEMFVIADHAND